MESGTPPPSPPPTGPPSTEPPTAAWLPPNSGPAPLPPVERSRSRTWIAIGAIVVVALVVLAFLFFSGVLSPGGNSAGAGNPVAYSAAVPFAIQSGANDTGGPWTVVGAEGIGVPATLSSLNAGSVTSNGCTITTYPGSGGLVTVSGTPASATPGTVATWVFLAKNASSNDILLIVVINGHSTPLAIVSGCSFVNELAGFDPITASGVVDSPTVAATFNTAGGAAFLKNNSGATQFYILFGGDASTGGVPAWTILYDSCPFLATSGTGTIFEGALNGQTGSLYVSPSQSSTAC